MRMNKKKRKREETNPMKKNKRRKILQKTKKVVKKKQIEQIKKDFVDFPHVKKIENIIKNKLEDKRLSLPVLMSIIMAETLKNNEYFNQDLTNDQLLEELKIYFPFFL